MKVSVVIGIIVVGGLIAAAALIRQPLPSAPAVSNVHPGCPDFARGSVTLGTYRVAVGIAVTPAEQSRGLSGCNRLLPATGLLFPYDPPKNVTFWMKDMLIPIDIIWIAGDRVVGIEHSVPPPAPGTSDEKLLRYASPEPVSAVLEVPAGTAQRQEIVPRTSVQIVN